MKKLIILRGLPGSGKTTFAETLAQIIDADVHVDSYAADDFFYDDDGVYHFCADHLHKAHMSCQQSVEVSMMSITADEFFCKNEGEEFTGGVIIVHNTNTQEKELKPYLELAKKYGFEVTSLIVENRHGNESVHGVPEEAMKRMRDRFSVKL